MCDYMWSFNCFYRHNKLTEAAFWPLKMTEALQKNIPSVRGRWAAHICMMYQCFCAVLVKEVDRCLCNMTAHVQSFSTHTLSNVNTVNAFNRHEVVASARCNLIYPKCRVRKHSRRLQLCFDISDPCRFLFMSSYIQVTWSHSFLLLYTALFMYSYEDLQTQKWPFQYEAVTLLSYCSFELFVLLKAENECHNRIK